MRGWVPHHCYAEDVLSPRYPRRKTILLNSLLQSKSLFHVFFGYHRSRSRSSSARFGRRCAPAEFQRAATRSHEQVLLGASPRGVIALVRAAQAQALLRGEGYVTPDHVKSLAPCVLAHRIVVKPRVRAQGRDGTQVVDEVLGQVEVPIDLPRPT